MSTLVVVVVVALGALAAFRFLAVRQVRLVRVVQMAAPPETVFDLVSQIEYMPEWKLRSRSLPRIFCPAALTSWGECIQPRDRLCLGYAPDSESLQLRSIPGREFGYRRASRGAVRYESVFRVAPAYNDVDTELRWEVHYTLLRTVDLLNPWSTRKAAWRAMDESVEAIRVLAESLASKPTWQSVHPLAS